MNSRAIRILGVILAAGAGAAIALAVMRDDGNDDRAASAAGGDSERARIRKLESEIAALRAEWVELSGIPPAAEIPPDRGEGGAASAGSAAESRRAIRSLADRLSAIEESIERLQIAMDGVSIEAASAERAELFTAADGNLKADEYFEAGKFAIAGEGYLKFLEAHPDHPDSRAILERARDAFVQAGYSDKAIWAHESLMSVYPETRVEDLRTLAELKKQSGRYDEATQHVMEAASLDDSSQRYWDMLYAAWYTELDQGGEAGLDFYRDVERQIREAGYGDQKLGQRAREKILELERRIAADP